MTHADQAQPAPLSDERLAEARRIVAMFAGTAAAVNFLWDSSVFVDLLAEVDRLRAEVAAREEIVRAVAETNLEKADPIIDSVEDGKSVRVTRRRALTMQARALLAADEGARSGQETK